MPRTGQAAGAPKTSVYGLTSIPKGMGPASRPLEPHSPSTEHVSRKLADPSPLPALSRDPTSASSPVTLDLSLLQSGSQRLTVLKEGPPAAAG